MTAKTPQRDKTTGEVRYGSKSRKPLFLPSAKSVNLTIDQIREHGDTGTRGVPSESQVLRAAAIVGDWLPVDALTGDWATDFIRNASVERVPLSVADDTDESDAA